jgi:hypothetical protein
LARQPLTHYTTVLVYLRTLNLLFVSVQNLRGIQFSSNLCTNRSLCCTDPPQVKTKYLLHLTKQQNVGTTSCPHFTHKTVEFCRVVFFLPKVLHYHLCTALFSFTTIKSAISAMFVSTIEKCAISFTTLSYVDKLLQYLMPTFSSCAKIFIAHNAHSLWTSFCIIIIYCTYYV